jgi:hypothetical protein
VQDKQAGEEELVELKNDPHPPKAARRSTSECLGGHIFTGTDHAAVAPKRTWGSGCLSVCAEGDEEALADEECPGDVLAKKNVSKQPVKHEHPVRKPASECSRRHIIVTSIGKTHHTATTRVCTARHAACHSFDQCRG